MDISGSTLIIVIIAVVVILMGFMWMVTLVRKVGPNEALIIYGLGTAGHPKVIKGGGTVVLPLLQSARELSLELMSFDVAPTQDLYTRQGVAVHVEAVAQIKSTSDPDSIRTAAEQLLRKSDQERVMAETASATKQAEAQRDLELKKAEYAASVRQQQATADKAYDIQANIMQQQVAAEQVKIERVQREEQIKVQDAEIQRRERELIATVLKPAEVERKRIETLAEAERQRRTLESMGTAEADRQQGSGQADAARAVG